MRCLFYRASVLCSASCACAAVDAPSSNTLLTQAPFIARLLVTPNCSDTHAAHAIVSRVHAGLCKDAQVQQLVQQRSIVPWRAAA